MNFLRLNTVFNFLNLRFSKEVFKNPFFIKPLLEVQTDIIYHKLDHASSLLNDYLKQNPKSIEALYKKAVVTQLQGNRNEAVKQLKSLRQSA